MGAEVVASENYLELGDYGLDWNVTGTLTWDSPVHPELIISIAHIQKCGNGGTCIDWIWSKQGSSPLTFSWEGQRGESREMLALGVTVPRITPSPVYGHAHAPIEFHVEGEAKISG